mmetsp:Transcript_91802/g.264783  ORF Transcript_91802/g.264783 Transcript_91802/m.264783 type:complete len:220 (+) Transcript_91802:1388-2047(+)
MRRAPGSHSALHNLPDLPSNRRPHQERLRRRRPPQLPARPRPRTAPRRARAPSAPGPATQPWRLPGRRSTTRAGRGLRPRRPRVRRPRGTWRGTRRPGDHPRAPAPRRPQAHGLARRPRRLASRGLRPCGRPLGHRGRPTRRGRRARRCGSRRRRRQVSSRQPPSRRRPKGLSRAAATCATPWRALARWRGRHNGGRRRPQEMPLSARRPSATGPARRR